MDPKILKSFDESIERLERLCGGKKKKRRPSRSDDESFKKSFNETAKEFKELGNKLILKKAVEAMERGDLSWHQVEVLESRLKKGMKIPLDFIRSLGIDVPGVPTRREAILEMEKALERGEISFREFQIGEDQLNKGIEKPASILKALETRRTKDSESSEDERFSKAAKKSPTIRVVERQQIPLSIRLSPRLSGEAEILVQNDEVDPWVGNMVSRSFRGKFV